MEKQIETVVELAANKYPLIHPDIDDYENDECILQRAAFIEGYQAANAAVQGYREALEKIANSNTRLAEDKNVLKAQLAWIRMIAKEVTAALSKAEEPTLAKAHIQPPRTNELRYDAAISDNATEAKQDLLNQEGINGAASLMFSKADYKARCLTCGQEHLNWSGSTPCCGSLSELIEPLQALAKAEDKGEVKKDFVQWLEEDGLPASRSILAELKAMNAAKENNPQPTNSLDELERWVKKNYVNYNYEERLLAKIQELKTITT